MGLKKILFTDDDPDIRNLIQVCLEDSDLVVEVCESGKETLERIPRFKPDLIILDVLMPRMDGVSTLKAIKDNRNLDSIPVVFMTAKSGNKEKKSLLELGAVDVIVKPFKPFVFAEKIREIWDKKVKKKRE